MATTPSSPHAAEADKRGPIAEGVLCAEQIRGLLRARVLSEGTAPIDPESQVQPASLDLRLGNIAYRLRASFLPGAERSVEARLRDVAIHTVDLTNGAVLETGAVYLVPLQERIFLEDDISASCNPKSSTGRLDVFTRVITDFGTAFDQIPAGHHGPLYLEVSPRTFPIVVRPGSRLAQIRFRKGDARLNDAALGALHEEVGLVDGPANISGGLGLSVDLSGFDGIAGYRARRHTAAIDVDKVGACLIEDFWEPITLRRGRGLILDPNEFYILASKECIHVPTTHAAEMVPFNPLIGEFRAHYAGFFDPGFGAPGKGNAPGARAVLEVRSHDVPFAIEDGQIVCRLGYEALSTPASAAYGAGIGSNYQGQGLKLSKHFAGA